MRGLLLAHLTICLALVLSPAAARAEHPCPCCAVDEARIEQILAEMSLEQKVAQMYLAAGPGRAGEARRLVRELGVGGVLLRPGAGLASSPRRIAADVARLQSWAHSGPTGLPLLVACEQQGGTLQALGSRNGGTDQPGNLGLAATFDPAATRLSYSIIGAQLYALGINADLAPVAELAHGTDPAAAQCFGQDPALVSAQVTQAVAGLESNRVIACARDFPARAAAPGQALPGLERMLPPFDAAVAAGVEMIMLSPAIYPALDSERPALASSRVVGLLRSGMGFEGVIVTDEPSAAAIASCRWDEPPDLAAIRAGADMLMVASPASGRRLAREIEGRIATVTQAVRQGRLDQERIDQAVRRILRLKMRYCLLDEPLRDPALAAAALNTPEQQAQSALLHGRTLTVVRDEQKLLAVKRGPEARVHVVCINRMPGQDPLAEAGSDLLEQVRRLAPQATGETFDVRPGAAARELIVRRAAQSPAELLLIGTYDARFYPEQALLVNMLLDLGRPTVVVALGSPYDLLAFPRAGTYLAAYSNRDLAVKAAARAALGLGSAEGKLPVDIPGLYPAGWSAAAPSQ